MQNTMRAKEFACTVYVKIKLRNVGFYSRKIKERYDCKIWIGLATSIVVLAFRLIEYNVWRNITWKRLCCREVMVHAYVLLSRWNIVDSFCFQLSVVCFLATTPSSSFPHSPRRLQTVPSTISFPDNFSSSSLSVWLTLDQNFLVVEKQWTPMRSWKGLKG